MKSSTLKAILGATNTGKTHSAILKMKEYNYRDTPTPIFTSQYLGKKWRENENE